MDQSPNLALPYLMPAQAQKHVTHNEALRMLDALTQITVASRTTATPPASPADGVRYILPTGATGVFAGAANRIAAFQDGAWSFFTPREGWIAWIADEDVAVAYSGTSWVSLIGAVATLGINATADPTNRLTVSAAATLLNNAGGGHQLKINKATTAATASLLFQSGFSGRAEMGTTGDDDFHIKVSADGSTFREALVIAGATGRATFPAGGVVTTTATSVTINVPGQASTIQAALDMLLGYRFEDAALGTVVVANGTYVVTAPLVCRHPQASRIVVKAATSATLPVEGDFVGTKATDEATLRTKFKTIVECSNVGACLASDGDGLGLVQDIAFIRTGTTGAPVGAIATRRGGLVFDRCGFSGFTVNLQARDQGFVQATSVMLLHPASSGLSVLGWGQARVSGSLVAYAAGNGIELTQGLLASDSGLRVKASGGSGLAMVSGSRAVLSGASLSGNTGPAIAAIQASVLEVISCTLSGGIGQACVVATDGTFAAVTAVTVTGDATQRSLVAQRASSLSTSGTHTGSPVFSPAVGTTGNSGSWVF